MASVRCGEVDRFKACLDEHHWLGHRVGGLVQTAAVPPPALRREQPAFLSGLRAVSGPIWPFCGARTDAAALSGDYQASYRYPVLVVETFTDPARHRGSCYASPLGPDARLWAQPRRLCASRQPEARLGARTAPRRRRDPVGCVRPSAAVSVECEESCDRPASPDFADHPATPPVIDSIWKGG